MAVGRGGIVRRRVRGFGQTPASVFSQQVPTAPTYVNPLLVVSPAGLNPITTTAGGAGCANILGTVTPLTGENISMCSNLAVWAFYPACWCMSPGNWQAAAALNPNLLVANVSPSGNLTPGQMQGSEPVSPEEQAAAGYEAGMQQILQQVQSGQPAIPYDCTAIGSIFTDTQNYFANCPTVLYWIGGAAGFLLLLAYLK
jgi:hypothetical protein